jgi:ABC-type transporter Mla MlaB component
MPQDTAVCLQLVLDGALTMRTAEPVRAALRAAIEPPSGVTHAGIAIDCTAATEIDLTCIQLLIATRLSARPLGVAVSLAQYPDGVLLDTLTRGGFRVVPETGGDGFWFTGAAA